MTRAARRSLDLNRHVAEEVARLAVLQRLVSTSNNPRCTGGTYAGERALGADVQVALALGEAVRDAYVVVIVLELLVVVERELVEEQAREEDLFFELTAFNIERSTSLLGR